MNLNPNFSRSRRLSSKYGIRIGEYFRMLRKQEGKCAICGEPSVVRSRTHQKQNTGLKFNLNVDHNHVTGAVRALLCTHCNMGLGCFRDNPDGLRMAAAYLERFDVGTQDKA